MRTHPLVVAAIICLTASSAPALTQQKPTVGNALAWLQKLDAEYKQPRFADMTVEKLAKTTELKLGGHRKSDNKHIEIDASYLLYLTALPALTKLSLGEVDGLTDSSMVDVAAMKQLTELDLSDAAISDNGVRHLANLTNLTLLNLAFARQVGDPAMEHVAKLTNLETLMLSGTKVTDAGLKSLSTLTKLKELRLAGPMAITEEGLNTLAENKALKKLILGKQIKMTDAAIASLKTKLPELVVEMR